MYESYWDDSGTDSNSPLAIAACYISRKSGWEQFTDSMFRIGREEGFETFHMADFASGAKPFDGWDGDKKRRVFRRVATAINQNKLAGFGVAIPKAVFDSVMPSQPAPVKAKCGKYHFTFAVKATLSVVARWREQSQIRLPMRYVFDRMGKGKGEIMDIFHAENLQDWDAIHKLGMEAGGVEFEDKSRLKPLQAADVLAWQMNWHMKNVIALGKHSADDCHPNFKLLRLHQTMELAFMTKENFINTIENELKALQRTNE
jgi:hypothetical protein